MREGVATSGRKDVRSTQHDPADTRQLPRRHCTFPLKIGGHKTCCGQRRQSRSLTQLMTRKEPFPPFASPPSCIRSDHSAPHRTTLKLGDTCFPYRPPPTRAQRPGLDDEPERCSNGADITKTPMPMSTRFSILLQRATGKLLKVSKVDNLFVQRLLNTTFRSVRGGIFGPVGPSILKNFLAVDHRRDNLRGTFRDVLRNCSG